MQIYSYAHILFCEPWQIIVAKCKDPPPKKKYRNLQNLCGLLEDIYVFNFLIPIHTSIYMNTVIDMEVKNSN